ncbi:MAG TPA: hypothetical protein DEP84_00410 [Chloroflexi bacterium]|nr:hypothetical protein [Chloroflexota bacterium]
MGGLLSAFAVDGRAGVESARIAAGSPGLAGEIRAVAAGSGDPAGAGGVRWLQRAGAGQMVRSGLWPPDLAIRRERVGCGGCREPGLARW